jgi:hypothetical protein
MYVINRNPDDNTGGVATLEGADVIILEDTPPTAEVVESGGEPITNAAEDVEDNDYTFEVESGSVGSGSPTPAAATTEERIPKAQYDKVVGELEALKQDFTRLQNEFESNVLVKAAIEYKTGLEAGVELNPADFYESYFGVDASRLGVEDLIRLQIREEATSLGQTLTDDTFQQVLDTRMMKYEDMDELQKAAFAKNLRDIRVESAREKQNKLINERKADIEKNQLFWKDAYENGVKPLLDKIAENGKKEFGLKGEVSKEEAERIAVALANNFYRYTKDNKLNYTHAVEVAQFSSDIAGYVKRVEDRAVAKYKAEQLKITSTRGSGLPSGADLLNGNNKKVISDKPLTNLLDGAEAIM